MCFIEEQLANIWIASDFVEVRFTSRMAGQPVSSVFGFRKASPPDRRLSRRLNVFATGFRPAPEWRWGDWV